MATRPLFLREPAIGGTFKVWPVSALGWLALLAFIVLAVALTIIAGGALAAATPLNTTLAGLAVLALCVSGFMAFAYVTSERVETGR